MGGHNYKPLSANRVSIVLVIFRARRISRNLQLLSSFSHRAGTSYTNNKGVVFSTERALGKSSTIGRGTSVFWFTREKTTWLVVAAALGLWGLVLGLGVASSSQVASSQTQRPTQKGEKEQAPTTKRPQPDEKTDIGALLKKAGIGFRRGPKKEYLVRVNLKETGDKHIVFIAPKPLNISGFEFFRLSAPAKMGYLKADPKWMGDLLDRNRTTLFGAWELQKVKGRYLPVFTSQVPVKASPLALKAALVLAVRAAYNYQGVPQINWFHRRIHLKGPKGGKRTIAVKGDRVVAKVGKFDVVIKKDTIEMGGRSAKIRGRVTIMITQQQSGPPTITVNRQRVFKSDL